MIKTAKIHNLSIDMVYVAICPFCKYRCYWVSWQHNSRLKPEWDNTCNHLIGHHDSGDGVAFFVEQLGDKEKTVKINKKKLHIRGTATCPFCKYECSGVFFRYNSLPTAKDWDKCEHFAGVDPAMGVFIFRKTERKEVNNE
jgi:hypothetical protein